MGERILPACQPRICGTASAPNYGWREFYGGVDATHDQWLAYSGMTVAPSWSNDIYSNGWRLRVGGGYGRYSYERDVLVDPVCGTPLSLACAYHRKRFDAAHSYAEALVGYYLQLGALTAKAFAGAAFSSNATSPPDPETLSRERPSAARLRSSSGTTSMTSAGRL